MFIRSFWKRFLVSFSHHHFVVFSPDQQLLERRIGGEHSPYLRIIGKGVEQNLLAMTEQGGASLNGGEELDPPWGWFGIDEELEFLYALENLGRGRAPFDEGCFGDPVSLLAQGNADLVKKQPSFQ